MSSNPTEIPVTDAGTALTAVPSFDPYNLSGAGTNAAVPFEDQVVELGSQAFLSLEDLRHSVKQVHTSTFAAGERRPGDMTEDPLKPLRTLVNQGLLFGSNEDTYRFGFDRTSKWRPMELLFLADGNSGKPGETPWSPFTEALEEAKKFVEKENLTAFAEPVQRVEAARAKLVADLNSGYETTGPKATARRLKASLCHKLAHSRISKLAGELRYAIHQPVDRCFGYTYGLTTSKSNAVREIKELTDGFGDEKLRSLGEEFIEKINNGSIPPKFRSTVENFTGSVESVIGFEDVWTGLENIQLGLQNVDSEKYDDGLSTLKVASEKMTQMKHSREGTDPNARTKVSECLDGLLQTLDVVRPELENARSIVDKRKLSPSTAFPFTVVPEATGPLPPPPPPPPPPFASLR